VDDKTLYRNCKKKEEIKMYKRIDGGKPAFVLTILLLTGLILVSCPSPAWAAGDPCGATSTITEVPVKVNVLSGVTISDDEIKDILKGINSGLEKEG